MDINKAVVEIEAAARAFENNGAKAVDVQVRPSGDEIDLIKVWVDLGPASADANDWAQHCETALAKHPAATGFRVHVRAEKL